MIAYLLLRDNIQTGPYSLDELKKAGIRATDLLWIEGKSTGWRYPDEIGELQAFVHASATHMPGTHISNTTLEIHHKNDSDNKKDKEIKPPDIGESADSFSMETDMQKKEELKPGRVPEIEGQQNPVQDLQSKRSQLIREYLIAQKESDTTIHKSGNAGESDPGPLQQIQIIIADDHTLFREGVKMALSQKKDIKILAEAENGAQLLTQLKHAHPDIILLDIQMPVMDGITALTAIRKSYPDLKVIMLSMHDDHSMISTLMETGANAYLTKTADSETIYQAIRTCYEKQYFFSEHTNLAMLESLRSKNRIPEKTITPKFDGSALMVKLTEAQKKSTRRNSLRVKKNLLVAGCILFLGASVYVISRALTANSIGNRSSIKPQEKPRQEIKTAVLPVSANPVPAENDPSKNIQANTPPGLQPALQTGSKKEAPIRRTRITDTPASNTRFVPAIQKLDSSALKENQKEEKQNALKGPDEKELVRSGIRNLVTASINTYHKGTFGGLSDIEITVKNGTAYAIDNVHVEVQYFLSGSKLYKTEELDFKNISPSASKQLEAPKSSRGVRIEYRIVTISSQELGM